MIETVNENGDPASPRLAHQPVYQEPHGKWSQRPAAEGQVLVELRFGKQGVCHDLQTRGRVGLLGLVDLADTVGRASRVGRAGLVDLGKLRRRRQNSEPVPTAVD